MPLISSAKSRSLPRLEADAPAATLPGGQLQDPHAGQHLSPRHAHRGDAKLPQVRSPAPYVHES